MRSVLDSLPTIPSSGPGKCIWVLGCLWAGFGSVLGGFWWLNPKISSRPPRDPANIPPPTHQGNQPRTPKPCSKTLQPRQRKKPRTPKPLSKTLQPHQHNQPRTLKPICNQPTTCKPRPKPSKQTCLENAPLKSMKGFRELGRSWIQWLFDSMGTPLRL